MAYIASLSKSHRRRIPAQAASAWYLPTGIVEADAEQYGTDLTTDLSFSITDLTDSDFTIAVSFTAYIIPDEGAADEPVVTESSNPRFIWQWRFNETLRMDATTYSYLDSGSVSSGVRTAFGTYNAASQVVEFFFDGSSLGTITSVTNMNCNNNGVWYGTFLNGLHYYVCYNKVLTSDQLTELHNNMTA